MKRSVCTQCHRPLPATCICQALPQSPISLKKCRVIVLQHPHEQRRKNRSLPVVELCFSKNKRCSTNETSSKQNENQTHVDNEYDGAIDHFDFHCIIAKRLGDQIDPAMMNLIQNKNYYLLLFYPSDDAISLQTALDSQL